jgi:GxxExxY protein
MSNYLYEEDTYKILEPWLRYIKTWIFWNCLQDAFEYELKKNKISFEREKEYLVHYKIILNHKFYADFVVLDKIILEIKSTDSLHEKHISQ